MSRISSIPLILAKPSSEIKKAEGGPLGSLVWVLMQEGPELETPGLRYVKDKRKISAPINS